jgi:hypothetical protein
MARSKFIKSRVTRNTEWSNAMGRIRMGLAAGLALAAIAVLGPAGAARARDGAATVLGVYGAWQSYTYRQGGGTVCYAAAAADRTQGGPRGRKPTYLTVTDRPGAVHEISLIGAYMFKDNSNADLAVDNMQNSFFTRGDSAWSLGRDADPAIVRAMVRGDKAVIHAVPKKGSPVTDIVSLNGFTKALQAIDRACRVSPPHQQRRSRRR